MARTKKELQILNVNLTLQLGKGRNYWGEPNVTRYENFEIPFRMFSVKALADLINDMFAEMPEELKEEIARFEAEQKAFEAEQKALEAEQKAKEEVSELTPIDIDALLSK